MRLAKLPSVTAWERARDKYYAIEANYIILSMKQEISLAKNGMNYLMNWNRRLKKQRKGTIQPVYQRLRNIILIAILYFNEPSCPYCEHCLIISSDNENYDEIYITGF